MPAVTCLKCGGVTNTALCDWLNCKKNKGGEIKYADRCYSKYVNGEWVDGCASNEIAEDQGNLIRKLNAKSKKDKEKR
jgi:hypothetical protein